MNIYRDSSSYANGPEYMAPRGYSQRPAHFALQDRPGAQAGIVLSGPPPRQLKDVLFTPAYAQGRMIPREGFWDKGANIRHSLFDPVSSAEVFQWHTSRGAQGEGFS